MNAQFMAPAVSGLGAVILDEVEVPVPVAPNLPTDWNGALGRYHAIRAYSEGLSDDSPDCQAATDECCTTLDHLVENVRAATPGHIVEKIKLARERWDGFTTPDSWWDALAADVEHLCALDAGMHGAWFKQRNALIVADCVVADDDIETLNRLDTIILAAPARSREAVISKLLLVTASAATGQSYGGDAARRIIEEARTFGFKVQLA